MAGVSRIAPDQVHGDLTVLARAGNRGEHAMWQCRCVCGTEAALDSRSLARGRLYSGCGCPGREKARGRNATWEAPVVAPKPAKRRPIETPLREMVRIGIRLGLSADAAMDATRLNAALRRADPAHPGVSEAGRKLVGLGHGRTVP